MYDILLERSEEDVLYQTAKVFYQTLQTEQLVRAVKANIEKFDALQRMVDLQLKNGFAIPTDVKRVRVARTNLETQHLNLLSGIAGLRHALQFLCGVPLDEPFEPVAAYESPGSDSSRWQLLTYSLENTTEFRLLARQIELYNIQWKSQRAEGLPALAIHGATYYRTQGPDARVFDKGNVWYGMATVGVKIKVPIFDGFRRHRKADLLRLEGQKLETDRTQLAGAKDLEYRQTRDQYQNALRLLKTQEENVGLAREIADKLILQYKEGVTPLTDVLNAQTLLSEAETNYWQQVFTYKLAVLNLLKASGRLEEIRKQM
jgi:outer membrane protein TolC